MTSALKRLEDEVESWPLDKEQQAFIGMAIANLDEANASHIEDLLKQARVSVAAFAEFSTTSQTLSSGRTIVTAPALMRSPVLSPQSMLGGPSERRTLVVGRGIGIQGTLQDAERLVVEGTIEASLVHAIELVISPGGMFKGEIEVEDAEIAGTIDGTLTARGNLIVRATGKILGTARCRRLQVEDGGQIVGRMEMLTEAAVRAAVGLTTA